MLLISTSKGFNVFPPELEREPGIFQAQSSLKSSAKEELEVEEKGLQLYLVNLRIIHPPPGHPLSIR